MQDLYNGEWEHYKQVAKRRLTSSEYEQLLARIASDPPLQRYFDEKVR